MQLQPCSSISMSSSKTLYPPSTSQPNQNLAPSSTYPQGLVVLGSPIVLRQPPLGIQITSGSHSDGTRLSASKGPSTSNASSDPGQDQLSTQETPPMAILNKRDFSLALSIRAAQADGRECPWYGVWAKVLQNYIFHDADGSQTACTCIPQYSLVASYDSGHSPEINTSDLQLATSRSPSDIDMGSPPSDQLSISAGSPPSYLPIPHFALHNSTPNFSPRSFEVFGGPLPTITPSPPPGPQVPCPLPDLESPTTRHVHYLRARVQHTSTNTIHSPVDAHPLPQSSTQTLSNDILPSTPPRPPTGRNYKSARVPDFVQVLERTQQLYPAVPDGVIRRVIMTIEIKPEPKGRSKPADWGRLWKDQVGAQAAHAFDADPTLQYLGIIMAYGRRWVYCTTRRPLLDTRTMSERRDPTFQSTGSPDIWESPEDSEDSDAILEDFEDGSSAIDPSLPLLECPSFSPETMDGEKIMYDYHLLDAKQESLRVFPEILEDLRNHNCDMWV
ncbi:hypothetical protein EDB19DRAFT_953506 [Suillus lakei]|nr:hypothetical protein EDB19DRAFT_953506 [Suillus lakei]